MADSSASTVLVIDDDRDLRYSLRRVLVEKGCRVIEAESGEQGLEVAKAEKPAVILLDNRMGGMAGVETLRRIRTAYPAAMVILMTAFGTTQTAIEAMKFGAFDYIRKPFDTKTITGLVEKAVRSRADLDAVGRSATSSAVNADDLHEGVVGNAESMQAVFKVIGQVAASDVTVLVTGESGTGKELVARSMHRHSLRAKKDFIAVNCAAIPENLIESELFGHVKGAFTGAVADKVGRFEQCDGGTLFLDEIGDMSPATQTRVLRAIQQGEIRRVGGSETIRVDVRLIAATNKNLEKMVAEKTFREDLYYRLNVVRIRMPSLRERKADIPLLVDFMLRRLGADGKIAAKHLSPEAMDLLCRYDWPGNVRELENAIHRAGVIARGDAVLAKDLPAEIADAVRLGRPVPVVAAAESPETGGNAVAAAPAAPGIEGLFDALYKQLRAAHNEDILSRVEMDLIRRCIAETRGNQLKASGILGINRSTLKKRVDEARSANFGK